MIGKIKTVTQMIAITFIMFEPIFQIILTSCFSSISEKSVNTGILYIGEFIHDYCGHNDDNFRYGLFDEKPLLFQRMQIML